MRKFFIVGLLTCSCFLQGQVWTNLIDSVPQQGWAVFSNAVVDSSSNTLYIGGEFYHLNKFKTSSIIKYNGITFDTLQSGLDDQGFTISVVRSMKMFQNKLYVFGNFKKAGKYWCNSIGRWNGASWDSINFSPKNGPVWQSDVYNNELYVSGTFDSIGGIASNCISKFDGTNWYNIGHPVKQNIITAIKNYKGKLYMAGQTTTASSSANLSYYDGSNWIPWVGVTGDNAKYISGMTVIDSMLYVYGRFNSIAGTNCKGLAAFNGTRWYGVGTGLSTTGGWETILNVQKLNGEIYVTGKFDKMEGIGTSSLSIPLTTNLVKFDGQKFCAVSQGFGNDVSGIVGYNNKIYAYGAFRRIGNDSVWGFVKWTGGNSTVVCSNTLAITPSVIGINELMNFQDLKIYPNPFKDKLNIDFTNFDIENVNIEVINSLGQLVSSFNFKSTKNEIELSDYPQGIYFLKIKKNSEQKVFKIIKE